MCENYGYEHIASYRVTTRVVRECGGCLRDWPAGTRMHRHVGKTEGDFGVAYSCPVCDYAQIQPEHSPLHICWGDLWECSGLDGLTQTWEHIRRCHASGRVPREKFAARLRGMEWPVRDGLIRP